jgi:hypothetical protein
LLAAFLDPILSTATTTIKPDPFQWEDFDRIIEVEIHDDAEEHGGPGNWPAEGAKDPGVSCSKMASSLKH